MKNYNVHEIEDLFKTGIYKITSKKDSKVYIGSASAFKNQNKKRNGFYRRWHDHIYLLSKNAHRNKHLQGAWNLYGADNFEFSIIENCLPEIIEEKELYYINLYDSCNHNKGYNMIKQSNLKNYHISSEHKAKLSKALKGKKRPQSDVEKWSKKVVQIDVKTNTAIAEFYSISEASRKTNIQRQDIGQSIIGKKCKTAGGFKWKLVKDIV
jgi:group I intron endonuclease